MPNTTSERDRLDLVFAAAERGLAEAWRLRNLLAALPLEAAPPGVLREFERVLDPEGRVPRPSSRGAATSRPGMQRLAAIVVARLAADFGDAVGLDLKPIAEITLGLAAPAGSPQALRRQLVWLFDQMVIPHFARMRERCVMTGIYFRVPVAEWDASHPLEAFIQVGDAIRELPPALRGPLGFSVPAPAPLARGLGPMVPVPPPPPPPPPLRLQLPPPVPLPRPPFGTHHPVMMMIGPDRSWWCGDRPLPPKIVVHDDPSWAW
jgi:hypothetical protein